MPGEMRYGSGRFGFAGAHNPESSDAYSDVGAVLSAVITVVVLGAGIIPSVRYIVSENSESEAVQVLPFATANIFDVPTVVPLYFAERVIPPVADFITNEPEYEVPLSVIELGVMLPIEGVSVIATPVGIFVAENETVNAVPFDMLGMVLKVISGTALVEMITVNDFEIVPPFVPVQLTVYSIFMVFGPTA
jgi:hypothetical protein